jgi:hypothetical protein
MIMVAVIVGVRVLVFDGLMDVLVIVLLRKMQHHARQHECATQRHQPARQVIPHDDCQGGTDERASAKTDPVRAAPNARCASR